MTHSRNKIITVLTSTLDKHAGNESTTTGGLEEVGKYKSVWCNILEIMSTNSQNFTNYHNKL